MQCDSGRLFFCQQCSGVWINGDQVEALLGGTTGQLLDVRASQDKLCPHCGNNSFHSGAYPGTAIVIDICGSCHGTWFDAGEFNAIRAMTKKTAPTGRSAPASEKVAAWVSQMISELWHEI